MNLFERSNYMIALIFSLAFHFLLLLLFIPGYIASKPASLETFPVGLVEIAAGSPDGSGGMMGSLPEGTEGVMPREGTIPGDAEKDKGKMTAKLDLNKKTPHEAALLVPKKESIAEEPGKTSVAGGSKTGGGRGIGTGQGTGGDGSGTGKPLGFGSGEGMVTVLGALPPYPKNAMNEGKEGDVGLRILVKADGSLEQANLTNSSGDSRLDKVSISTIERRWKFKPTTKDYYIDLVFSFNVQSGVTVKFINSESRP